MSREATTDDLLEHGTDQPPRRRGRVLVALLACLGVALVVPRLTSGDPAPPPPPAPPPSGAAAGLVAPQVDVPVDLRVARWEELPLGAALSPGRQVRRVVVAGGPSQERHQRGPVPPRGPVLQLRQAGSDELVTLGSDRLVLLDLVAGAPPELFGVSAGLLPAESGVPGLTGSATEHSPSGRQLAGITSAGQGVVVGRLFGSRTVLGVPAGARVTQVGWETDRSLLLVAARDALRGGGDAEYTVLRCAVTGPCRRVPFRVLDGPPPLSAR